MRRLRSSARVRRGVSILEVLFAILVTSVGLLGAIAIFPVASSQARKGRIYDQTASAGREAVHLFDTLGMRRLTDRWYYWTGTNYAPVYIASSQTFNSTSHLTTPYTYNLQQSYCIDTRMIVRNTANWNNTGTSIVVGSFPYVSPNNIVTTGLGSTSPQAWMNRIAFFPGTLNFDTTVNPAPYLKDQFDRFSKALPDAFGAPATGRNLLLADSIFQFDDDYAFLRPGIDDVSKLGLPNDRAYPAFQYSSDSWNIGSGNIVKRPTLGHFSWMATIVPLIDAYSGAQSDEFILSVVVFNDRPTDLYLNPGGTANDRLLERTVAGYFQNLGETGGEILLTWTATQSTANDELAKTRLKLRSGDWLMVGGVQKGIATNVNRFKWYRVAHCDPEIDYGNNSPGAYSRYATLVGEDWNMSVGVPANNPTYVEVTLMEGVVGVFEKTIRLDYGSTF